MNSSVEVNAPYSYLSTISQPLAEKGYYVFPVSVVDTFLKENGLPTPAEMNGIALDKIVEVIGAVVSLIAGEISDNSPQVARFLSAAALYSVKRS